MLNHYRTLLLNLPPGGADVAEEKIPAAFTPVALPACVQAVRRVLFGATPDRAMLNYRGRQLLRVVHATPLVEWVTRLDPRLAYAPDAALVGAAAFVPVVTQYSGPAAALPVTGGPADPDATGVVRLRYVVDVTSTTTVTVTRLTEPQSAPTTEFALTGGLSAPVELRGAGYGVRLTTDNPGASWGVEVLLRPQRDPGELCADLESVGDARLVELFGLERTEPWVTLRRVWAKTRETPLRLAAAVTAAVYRTEEARRG